MKLNGAHDFVIETHKVVSTQDATRCYSSYLSATWGHSTE